MGSAWGGGAGLPNGPFSSIGTVVHAGLVPRAAYCIVVGIASGNIANDTLGHGIALGLLP